MSAVVARWVGGVLVVSAAVGLAVYAAVVGLDHADQLASVISAMVGLVGLVMTAYGLIAGRRAAPADAGATVHNTVDGATVQGAVVQARDIQEINLGVTPPGRPDAPSVPAD